VIDLHTHTTASDGRCTPEELVARAVSAGVTVLAVTDHDTVGGLERADDACRRAGIVLVPGIEITSVVDGRDIHVLGYYLDWHSLDLAAFLDEQRQNRIRRVRRVLERLADHGIVLDADAILAPALADRSVSVGRPWVARAMISSGDAVDSNDAFERWLGRGRPAFVPRIGPSPDEVFACIHGAGGVASLAHPVLVGRDEWIPTFAAAGLDALEAYHSDHDAAATAHYLAIADRMGLAVSGGSDFHADDAHGGGGPGSVSLPPDRFDQLRALGVR
jgi:predicted metal-dependent phosphoesterase TrpH